MVYRIRYYDKEGGEIASAPWGGSLEQARRIADGAMVGHKAATMRIFDEDQGNRKVWPRH